MTSCSPRRQARYAPLFVLFLLLSLTPGCRKPNYSILQMAEPNPLAGVSAFLVDEVTFRDLRVKGAPEAGYVATLEEDKALRWEGDKPAIAHAFQERLAESSLQFLTDGAATDTRFRIRANVIEITPGFYAYWAAEDSFVRMSVQILTMEGDLVDDLLVHAEEDANLTHPDVRQRLRGCARSLADELVDYLEERTR